MQFCDEFVKYIYPRARLVELVDALTVPTALHHGKQQSAITTNSNLRNVCGFPRLAKLRLRYRRNEKICYLLLLEQPAESAWNVALLTGFKRPSAANFFTFFVEDFTGEKERISKNQVVAMAENTPMFEVIKTKTTKNRDRHHTDPCTGHSLSAKSRSVT